VVLENNQISGCDGRTTTDWWNRLISPVSSGKLGSRIATSECDDIPALMAISVVVLEAITSP
jgi:hypothetical protein